MFARAIAAVLATAAVASVGAEMPAVASARAPEVREARAPATRLVPAGSGPLRTAVQDISAFGGPEAGLALARTRAAGAAMVRLTLNWNSVAPTRRPSAPSDPASPEYRWSSFDREVQAVVARGLEPMVMIFAAPEWAQVKFPGRNVLGGDVQRGIVWPELGELAAFSSAAARRYSGRFDGLPRVRYWQLWNEQNHWFWFWPQFDGKTPVGPARYRSMLNTFTDAVHGVRRDNVAIAGGLAPFSSGPVEDWKSDAFGPLRFMRLMFCLSPKLQRTCNAQVRFDAWATHPYTSGGPTRRAVRADDVSLGDLPEMRRVLAAGARSGAVVSRRPVEFWVTEFSWDTKPPDPQGVPLALHARWTAEALYRAWKAGVSVVTWFQLRDEPFARQSYFQSGLYFRGNTLAQDRPKPTLRAFRFPFVAFRERGTVQVWGRTPTSSAGPVQLEQQAAGRWVRLRTVRANRHGIFEGRLRVQRPGPLRAAFRNERSVPFSLARPPDRFVRPFGTYP